MGRQRCLNPERSVPESNSSLRRLNVTPEQSVVQPRLGAAADNIPKPGYKHTMTAKHNETAYLLEEKACERPSVGMEGRRGRGRPEKKGEWGYDSDATMLESYTITTITLFTITMKTN